MKKRVSPEEKIAIKLAAGLGVPVATIARRMGYSDVTIYSILGRTGKKHARIN